MKKHIIIALIACSSNFVIAQISEKQIKKDISYLASDKLKGRGTSSNEEKIAANYIASSFKKNGLTPKGNEELLI